MKQETLAFAIFEARKMTFSKFSKMQIFLPTQSYLILESGVSNSLDIIARFVSLSSVIADL